MTQARYGVQIRRAADMSVIMPRVAAQRNTNVEGAYKQALDSYMQALQRDIVAVCHTCETSTVYVAGDVDNRNSVVAYADALEISIGRLLESAIEFELGDDIAIQRTLEKMRLENESR